MPPRRSRKPILSRALQEAEAIVRSARADEIDWTREPLTERERRVRVAILDRVRRDPILVKAFALYRPAASDLRAMLTEVGAASPTNIAGLLQDAKAEADGESPAHDGREENEDGKTSTGAADPRMRAIFQWALREMQEARHDLDALQSIRREPSLGARNAPEDPQRPLPRSRIARATSTRPQRSEGPTIDADTFAAMHDEHFLSLHDAASIMGLSYNFVQSRVACEDIPSYYFGRRRLIKAGALRRYIQDGRTGER